MTRVRVKQQDLRKRVLLTLIAHHMTLWPLLGGMSALGVSLVGVGGAIVPFVGVLCLLISIANLFTQLTINRKGVVERALADMEKELHEQREAQLDELARALSKDKDPRDEEMLDELRALITSLEESRTFLGDLTAIAALDIYSKVEQLFSLCVHQLQYSHGLLQQAAKAKGVRVKGELKERRERILGEVHASINKLREALNGIEQIGRVKDRDSEVIRLHQELDQNLRVAARVEERLAREGLTFDKDRLAE